MTLYLSKNLLCQIGTVALNGENTMKSENHSKESNYAEKKEIARIGYKAAPRKAAYLLGSTCSHDRHKQITCVAYRNGKSGNYAQFFV